MPNILPGSSHSAAAGMPPDFFFLDSEQDQVHKGK
jgi:hypothetical protein